MLFQSTQFSKIIHQTDRQTDGKAGRQGSVQEVPFFLWHCEQGSDVEGGGRRNSIWFQAVPWTVILTGDTDSVKGRGVFLPSLHWQSKAAPFWGELLTSSTCPYYSSLPRTPKLWSWSPHKVPYPHQCPLLPPLCQGHSAVWRSSLIISIPLHYWELLNFSHEATWACFLMAPVWQPSPEIILRY